MADAPDTVVLLDQDHAICDSLGTLLHNYDLQVQAFRNVATFWQRFHSGQALCVICEAALPDASGIEVHRELQRRQIVLPFALMISSGVHHTTLQAVRAGIEHIIRKPLVSEQLLAFVQNAQTSWNAPSVAGITDGR